MQPNLSIFACEYLSGRYDLSESSKSLTERAVDYLIAAVGDKPVDQYRPSHIRSFMAWIASRGAERSVKNYRKHLSPVFTAAQGDGLLSANPVVHVKCPRLPKRPKETYESRELQCILSACPNDEWAATVLVAATTGLRRGEILNLRRQDVDFPQQVISVCVHADSDTGWAWKPKSIRSIRLVAMPQCVTLRLYELAKERIYLMIPPARYRYMMNLKARGQLTSRNRKCPISNWSRIWKSIQEKSNVRHRRFHDLRATHLTNLSESGLRIEEIAQLAGHNDVRTTQEYLAVHNQTILDKQRASIGATGLEPATS